jgi:glycosyltransferase involved in cell wall biosynthesis
MKIAIDALGIHYYGGGRSATLNLFEPLFSLDDKNEYLIFLSQPEPTLQSSKGNVQQQIAPIKNRFLLRIWAQLIIPKLIGDCDLIHFAKNLGVFRVPIRFIITLYDITTVIHQELFPRIDVWYWKYIQNITLKQSDAVIAISNSTAKDISNYYQLPKNKIRVIYPAIARRFSPASKREITRVKNLYHLPKDYFLHVGHIERKKNLTLLVKGYSEFIKQNPSITELVLVGEEYPKTKDNEFVPTIKELGLTEKIIFTGRVPDSDLPALYSGSAATVFPSLHEGFGLTPIEAMACGSPVIGSDAGALPEVTGGAALILDSITVDSLAEAFDQIINDHHLVEKYRSLGYSRARQFSGEKTASATLSLYQEIGNL